MEPSHINKILDRYTQKISTEKKIEMIIKKILTEKNLPFTLKSVGLRQTNVIIKCDPYTKTYIQSHSGLFLKEINDAKITPVIFEKII